MAGRDIQIPFGPDKTGGLPLDDIPSEGDERLYHDPFNEPRIDSRADTLASTLPNLADDLSQAQPSPYDTGYETAASETGTYAYDAPAVDSYAYEAPAAQEADSQAYGTTMPAQEYDADLEADSSADGYSEEKATAQGMDEIQMSILALKDSIGQGRELKEREKERQELAEALEADHIELADREDILANYQALVSEQDAIIYDRSQKRDAAKGELSQLTIALEQTQAQLESLREQHALQLQPLEGDLGRARAAADQAKNDERSRKSELSAAESELRKADEADANTMAVARHQQVQAAYDEAKQRSEQAKEQLAQIQKAYDDAKQRSEQAQGPLERNIEDLNRHIETLKEDINKLGEELSIANNRRQYCDTVYQYPDETAKMRSEVEQAEALARQMDAENDVLREQLAESKQKARTAKVAIGVVIAIIVLIIVAFIVVSGR